jgi:RHS repeat-associated protein
VTEGYSTWLGNSPPQGRSGGDAAVPEYRYVGINATLYANGEAVAMNRLNTSTYTGGTVYLGKDVMGSVRGISNDYGLLEDRYEYDAFGKPYKGDLNGGMNLGYTGKPYDTTTGLYNYGYRDYQPEAARFTTVDPIRDGANWFAYVNNDPVNWVDLWGLQDAMAIRQTLMEAAAAGYAIPDPITTAAAIIITGIIVADQISGGKISQGIADFVDSLISPSTPVRDKEGNPIPAGNQPQSPTGKGANSGPKDIGDPGDLGGTGFKPPDPNNPMGSVAVIGGTALAGAALIGDMEKEVYGPLAATQAKISGAVGNS